MPRRTHKKPSRRRRHLDAVRRDRAGAKAPKKQKRHGQSSGGGG